MCRTATDFNGAAPAGSSGTDSSGTVTTTCADASLMLLSSMGDKTWATLTAADAEAQVNIANILNYVGTSCCGSKAQTRLLDDSSLCIDPAHFTPTVMLNISSLEAASISCQDFSDGGLAQAGTLSWNTVTCPAFRSKTWTEDGQVNLNLKLNP